MTIAESANRKTYTGNAVTTSFSFPYPVLLAADLVVYVGTTLKVLTTDYTLSGSAPYYFGTNVQFVSAPANLSSIVILCDPSITQAVDIVDNDDLPGQASIETPLDKLTLICRRLKDLISRSLAMDDSLVSSFVPTLTSLTPLGYLRINSLGTKIETYIPGTDNSALAIALGSSSGDALIGTLSAGAGAVGRAQQSKNRDFVHVRDFGAVVDGVTNDTAACALAAQSSTNPTIYVPEGTMVLTTSPSAGGSSPLWIMQKGALISGSGILPGQVVYEEPGVSTQHNSINFAPFTNDASIQVRCGEDATGDINFSYATKSGGNGIWLWPAGSSATPMRFYSITGSSGVKVINVGSCSINFVAAQALAFNTAYYIYAHALGGSLDFNFSNTLAPSFSNPFGFTPITGWACANGDPRQRYVGLVKLDGSGNLLLSGGSAPNGVVAYNLCSYYNRQRTTLQSVPTGNTNSATWTATGITNGLLSSVVIPDGYEPFITASGSLSNSSGGANSFIGISLNGASPDSWAQIGQSNANYAMPFSITYPAGSPNYVGSFGGRNTYQIMMKCDAGTVTLNSGCVFAGSFEN